MFQEIRLGSKEAPPHIVASASKVWLGAGALVWHKRRAEIERHRDTTGRDIEYDRDTVVAIRLFNELSKPIPGRAVLEEAGSTSTHFRIEQFYVNHVAQWLTVPPMCDWHPIHKIVVVEQFLIGAAFMVNMVEPGTNLDEGMAIAAELLQTTELVVLPPDLQEARVSERRAEAEAELRKESEAKTRAEAERSRESERIDRLEIAGITISLVEQNKNEYGFDVDWSEIPEWIANYNERGKPIDGYFITRFDVNLHSNDSDRPRSLRFVVTFGPVNQRITVRDLARTDAQVPSAKRASKNPFRSWRTKSADDVPEGPHYSRCELVDAMVPRFVSKRERFSLQ